MYPSIKTIQKIEWLSKVGNELELAKEVRSIFESDHKPYEKIRLINLILKTHGIESFKSKVYGYVEYCNTGDTYATTIMYSYHRDNFMIGSWGDIVERESK